MPLSRWRRHLQLWLLFLLYWFVCCGNPVTEETAIKSQNVPVEKVYTADTIQLVTTSTPTLELLHHTETIISDNIDTNNFVITPAVAPATPLEDIKLSSVAIEVASEETQQPLHSQDDLEVQTEKKDDNEGKIEENSDQVKEINKSENRTNTMADVNETKPVENSNLPVIDGGNIDNDNDIQEDLKLESKDKNVMNNEPLSTSEELISSNKNVENSEETKDIPEESNDIMDSVPEESQVPNEDMPSFKEWSQKFLAQEEEKNKVHQNNEKGSAETNSQPKKKKSDRKQNNYASVDCGAKILEKNPEARNAESILLENKDLYMLNPCSANISFIVELCDHAHVTSIQLANFEMFSSTTEKFQVSFSTRYPTREWTQLQKFTAKSEKLIQTFTIDPIFAKYMKVEQLSHHGSEHYCPWSLLRVYGNSMVEEYEEQESSHDSDTNLDDDDNTSSNIIKEDNVSNGILHTATEAVLNFVKETAKKLVTTPTIVNSTNQTNSSNTSSSSQLSSNEGKTIVQLMDRQDFEASCEEGTHHFYIEKCLAKTQNSAHSREMFLEIIHKECRRLLNISRICSQNITKISNKTIVEPLHLKKNGKNTVQDDFASSQTNTLIKSSNSSEQTKASEISENFDNLSKTNKLEVGSAQSLQSRRQSSVLVESVETNIELKQESIITPSTSVSSSNTPSSSTSHDVERPSSPTPLAQPPLAVEQQPDKLSAQLNSDVKDHSSTSSTSTDSSAVTETVDSLSSGSKPSTEDVISQHTTTITASVPIVIINGSKAAANTPEMIIMEESDTERRDERIVKKEDEILGASTDKPNPHVDVLKITLTDEKTKEGTAELEGEEDVENKEDFKTKNGVDQAVTQASDEESKEGTKDVELDNLKNISETKESHVSKSKIGEKIELDGTKHLENENTGTTFDHEETKRDLDAKNSEIYTGPSTLEKPQSDLQQNYLAKVEETCDQREHRFETDDSKESKINKVADEVGFESGTDPGPSIPVNTGDTNGKKESVFVSMSRKIKGLEQNVTMTNLFLEELSQRYRKSLEEMQKKLEKKLSTVSKNSKFLTQVNSYQNTTILVLTSKLEKLEHELKEVTLRLQVINQEVVERHLLGMVLQVFLVFILWFFLGRSRSYSVTDRRKEMNRRRLPLCENGLIRDNDLVLEIDTDQKINSIEEFHAPKTPDSLTESKRRRRRKHRSGTADQLLLHNSEVDQNIVTRTAGLLFNSPSSHDEEATTKQGKAAQRSCSLNDLGRSSPEQKTTTRRACSPKSKKPAYRNGGKNAGSRIRLFGSDDSKMNMDEDVEIEHKGLKKSKSLEETEVKLYNNALTSCSLQSSNNQLQNEKRRWIWGLG